MNQVFVHSDDAHELMRGDGLRAIGVDLASGPDAAYVAVRDGMLGRIDCFGVHWSPGRLHWPERRGARRRAGSARRRKAALHAAGMRSGRLVIRRKILPPWVSIDELMELARRDVERRDLARPMPPDGVDALAYALNPFRNTAAETSGMADAPEFRRTGGGVICQACGKEYRRHPHSEHRDWNGDPFLNVLCNGDLVKL